MLISTPEEISTKFFLEEDNVQCIWHPRPFDICHLTDEYKLNYRAEFKRIQETLTSQALLKSAPPQGDP